MKIRKAVITAAGRRQRTLPLQTLIDRDGEEKSVLAILVDEAVRASAEEIAVVVWPGDEEAYSRAAGDHAGRLRFLPQHQPRGYGHAVFRARSFTAGEPFLHLVGDHLAIARGDSSCAQRLVEVAEAESCSVSAVQPTREGLLPIFGAVGGNCFGPGLYRVHTVLEKPTPTLAEQTLVVPGLRAGFYLCFFGMHVLTPEVMDLLERLDSAPGAQPYTLSDALAELARRQQYLALEMSARRYDIGARYGLLAAQLALALAGRDREEVLSQLVELLAGREVAAGEAAGR